ncbi:MAG: nuclear transport factor 2 family protein [bacterium]
MDKAERARNMELLREGTAAYNRGDLSFVLQRAGDDIEVHAHRGLVNAGTYHGREAFEDWMRNWLDAWREITLEVRGVELIGDSFLLVDAWQRGIGQASGIPVEMEITQLIEVRDAEIKRFHLYPNRELAQEALERLREDAQAREAAK